MPLTVMGELVNICPPVGLLMDAIGGVVSGTLVPANNAKSTPQAFPLFLPSLIDAPVEQLVQAGMKLVSVTVRTYWDEDGIAAKA